MSRTNIDIDDELVHRVMMQFGLTTKREAVDYALRHLVGQPMTREEMIAMAGTMPDFEIPEDPEDFEVDWHDDPR
jgi:Arc/MetJ family transcription regulator